MQKRDRIDYAKLLGFDLASDELSGGVDFQDERFEARFGAKVGGEVLVALDVAAPSRTSKSIDSLFAAGTKVVKSCP